MTIEKKVMVSIIVPVYNREKLVTRAIKSIQQQSYQDWELILIDDASTDNTKQIIHQEIATNPRIKLVDNKYSKGPSGGRNTGLDYAQGKYIAYQDSDDEWAPHHLETMLQYLEKYPDKIDLMSANPLRKNEADGSVFNYDELDLTQLNAVKLDDGYLINRDELFDIQLRGRAITTQCMVGKAELMKSTRWREELKAAVDIMHNLELAAKDIGVCHIQDYHAIYWAHDDNLTNVAGVHDAKRMERVHNSFARYWTLVLEHIKLNKSQQTYVKENLAKCYAWHLAYHTYEPQKKYKEAMQCYFKAIALNPLRLKYWRSFIKSFSKRVLNVK
jgi:glycosyltransferase involved in cell wall biosynthesis